MRKIKLKSYEYIENLNQNESELMLKARQNSEKIGLGAISLSSVEANILKFFTESLQPKKVVEIGTLTGLSALYILSALAEEAHLWTLEKSAEHAELAKQVLAPYIEKKQCQILVGDAREKLNDISDKGPFDIIFIDGNKAAYLDYFNWALAHIRVGGLIIADNVFLSGAVWGDSDQQKFNDKQIKVVHSMNEIAFKSKNLQSIILPTEEGLLICKKLF